jgi:undecaprenyl-diphosphatase
MQQVVIFMALGLTVLAVGALSVCPDGQCALSEFDRIGLSLAHDLRNEPLDRLMLGVTWLGSLWLLLPLTVLGAVALYWRGRRREAGFILLALLSTSALSHVVKLWVSRPRPDLFPAWLPMPEDWSYPSAHTMQITAAALALFFMVGRPRSIWVVPLAIAVLAVAMSRIYLQVHFPSDVVAGMVAAALWVAGLHALIRPRSIEDGRLKKRGVVA